jgi:tripartite-type tricarboxylate transporter receptor subunit TctC
VPYRGASQATQDLVAGQIDLMFNTPSNVIPQVRAGTIKAYALTAKNRSAAAPDIPTVDETGLPGFHESSWWALFAPKGTPKDVIRKLNTAVIDALANPPVRQLRALRFRRATNRHRRRLARCKKPTSSRPYPGLQWRRPIHRAPSR